MAKLMVKELLNRAVSLKIPLLDFCLPPRPLVAWIMSTAVPTATPVR